MDELTGLKSDERSDEKSDERSDVKSDEKLDAPIRPKKRGPPVDISVVWHLVLCGGASREHQFSELGALSCGLRGLTNAIRFSQSAHAFSSGLSLMQIYLWRSPWAPAGTHN